MAAKSGSNIQFNYFKTTFRLPEPKKTAAWLDRVVKLERSSIGSLSYVFCTDSYLLGINKKYLAHDTLTDIITFDYTEKPGSLEGEIYISVPRVKENAKKLGVDLDAELHRVIVHGVLHLVGYGDKGKEKIEMRKREDGYLELRVSRGTG
ncbi:MAG TPA: rRNA maturation RNase YbeY [Cyclobacteriaceae bacterium]|nr:rRNA maturation RNase YbeY [Cyclobacteriaceae bacterium]